VKTEWNNMLLPDAYINHPGYADVVIDAIFSIVGAKKGDKLCDVGAGVAHLSVMLAAIGMDVLTIESNNVIRATGIKSTAHLADVR
jgi:hypothetical protein